MYKKKESADITMTERELKKKKKRQYLKNGIEKKGSVVIKADQKRRGKDKSVEIWLMANMVQ